MVGELSFHFNPKTNFAFEFCVCIGCTFILLFFVLVTALVERLKKETEEKCCEEYSTGNLTRRKTRSNLAIKSTADLTRNAKEEINPAEEMLAILRKLCCYKENRRWKVAAIRFLLRPFQLLMEFICVIWMVQIFWNDRYRVYETECPEDIPQIGGKGKELSLHRRLSECHLRSDEFYISDASNPRNYFKYSIAWIVIYQVLSAALTLALDFHNPMHGFRSACYQFFGIRGIVQMYREVLEDGDSFQMLEHASLQALFFSYPMLLTITIYAFEAFQDGSQGEWYLLMYILGIVSPINLARAINYRDHYGLIHKTLFQNVMLILWRVSEVYLRIGVMGVFAAYVNKTLVYIYIAVINSFNILYQMSHSTLFRANRGETSPKRIGTSNWLREFVDIIFRTVFDYLFWDLLNEGFGLYMNVYKTIENIIMITVLLIKNEHKFEFGTKEHADLDWRLFMWLRLVPGVVIFLVTSFYFYSSGNFNFERYRSVTKRHMKTLIDVKAWDVIKALIERKEIETLRQRNADRIFAKLRDPYAEDGVNIELHYLKDTLKYTLGQLCRLRVPMEEVTPYIKWKDMKKTAIKMLEQNLKRNNAKAESSKPFPPNTDKFLKGDSENAAEASEADEQAADREDSASGKVSDLEEIISNDSESKAVSSIELANMNKEKITPQQDPKANNKTSETSEEQKSVPQASTPEVNMSSGGVDSSNDSKPAKIQTHQTAAVPDQKQDKDVSEELTTENQASTDDKDSSICSCFRLLWPKGDEKQKDNKSSNQKEEEYWRPCDKLQRLEDEPDKRENLKRAFVLIESNNCKDCAEDHDGNQYVKTLVRMRDIILEYTGENHEKSGDEECPDNRCPICKKDYKKDEVSPAEDTDSAASEQKRPTNSTDDIRKTLLKHNINIILWEIAHPEDGDHDAAEYRDYDGEGDFTLFDLECNMMFVHEKVIAERTFGKEDKVFHVLLKNQTSDSDAGLYIFRDLRKCDDISLEFLKNIPGQQAQDDMAKDLDKELPKFCNHFEKGEHVLYSKENVKEKYEVIESFPIQQENPDEREYTLEKVQDKKTKDNFLFTMCGKLFHCCKNQSESTESKAPEITVSEEQLVDENPRYPNDDLFTEGDKVTYAAPWWSQASDHEDMQGIIKKKATQDEVEEEKQKKKKHGKKLFPEFWKVDIPESWILKTIVDIKDKRGIEVNIPESWILKTIVDDTILIKVPRQMQQRNEFANLVFKQGTLYGQTKEKAGDEKAKDILRKHYTEFGLPPVWTVESEAAGEINIPEDWLQIEKECVEKDDEVIVKIPTEIQDHFDKNTFNGKIKQKVEDPWEAYLRPGLWTVIESEAEKEINIPEQWFQIEKECVEEDDEVIVKIPKEMRGLFDKDTFKGTIFDKDTFKGTIKQKAEDPKIWIALEKCKLLPAVWKVIFASGDDMYIPESWFDGKSDEIENIKEGSSIIINIPSNMQEEEKFRKYASDFSRDTIYGTRVEKVEEAKVKAALDTCGIPSACWMVKQSDSDPDSKGILIPECWFKHVENKIEIVGHKEEIFKKDEVQILKELTFDFYDWRLVDAGVEPERKGNCPCIYSLCSCLCKQPRIGDGSEDEDKDTQSPSTANHLQDTANTETVPPAPITVGSKVWVLDEREGKWYDAKISEHGINDLVFTYDDKDKKDEPMTSNRVFASTHEEYLKERARQIRKRYVMNFHTYLVFKQARGPLAVQHQLKQPWDTHYR